MNGCVALLLSQSLQSMWYVLCVRYMFEGGTSFGYMNGVYLLWCVLMLPRHSVFSWQHSAPLIRFIEWLWCFIKFCYLLTYLLHLYGHVLRKEDNDWVKKCMEYEVEGAKPKRTWTEVVQKCCQACKLNREGATDCSKWRKLIKDGWWSW